MADSAAPVGVTNVYAPLSELKSRLSIVPNENDGTLWQLLHVSSRMVDRYCNRHFYVRTASRRFDVEDWRGFTVSDLISVNQMVEDRDGDGVFEETLSRSGYQLYPLDAEPESAHGAGYSRVHHKRNGSTRGFPVGEATVQITGRWGFRSHFVDLGANISNIGSALTSASRSMLVDDDANVRAGQTILVDGEQMFVKQVGANTLNIVREVNGTLAVDHPDGSSLKVLQYPAEIAESTLLLAVDRWRRRDGYLGGSSASGSPDSVYDSREDVARLLAPFRRILL